MKSSNVTNIVIAGLGGQGVLKASDILSEAAFRSGLDVKKSEIHGMAQRGGSVSSDVRYGAKVWSPMVPAGQAHFLLVLEPTQVENNRHLVASGGRMLHPAQLLGEGVTLKALERNPDSPVTPRNFNVAMLGILSVFLELSVDCWQEAIRNNLPQKAVEENLSIFELGRQKGLDILNAS